MGNKNTQEKIQHFLEIIEKNAVHNPHLKKPLFENGLVAFDTDNGEKYANKVFAALSEGKGLLVVISNPQNYEEFVKILSIANREGQWIIADLQCDPHPEIIKILKQLAEDNETTISNFKDKEFYQIKLNPKTRIIFCAKRELIEKEMSYPYFYNLFGPVLNL